jgi:hypothetical protein
MAHPAEAGVVLTRKRVGSCLVIAQIAHQPCGDILKQQIGVIVCRQFRNHVCSPPYHIAIENVAGGLGMDTRLPGRAAAVGDGNPILAAEAPHHWTFNKTIELPAMQRGGSRGDYEKAASIKFPESLDGSTLAPRHLGAAAKPAGPRQPS